MEYLSPGEIAINAFTALLSLVLLPLGLLLWQFFEASRISEIGRKYYFRASGCSCLGQISAFIISLILSGGELHAIGGAAYAILCSIASYFILQQVARLPEPEARSSAIWIAIVSIPAQIYAFGWVLAG